MKEQLLSKRTQLVEKQEEINEQIEAIDKVLALFASEPPASGGTLLTQGLTYENKTCREAIMDFMEKWHANEALTVAQIADGISSLGYSTESNNLRTIVNNECSRLAKKDLLQAGQNPDGRLTFTYQS